MFAPHYKFGTRFLPPLEQNPEINPGYYSKDYTLHTFSRFCGSEYGCKNQEFGFIMDVPYSLKYWRELNLAVGSQIAITNILADLNLAVWYGITIRIYVSAEKFWRILIWRLLRQSTKPPNLISHQIFQLYSIAIVARCT